MSKAVLAFFLLFALFAAYSWWELSGLRGFCGQIKPGDPMSALADMAATHHQNARWLRTSVPNRDKGNWLTFVPASSTMGEVVCAIEHDKKVVISAAMLGD